MVTTNCFAFTKCRFYLIHGVCDYAVLSMAQALKCDGKPSTAPHPRLCWHILQLLLPVRHCSLSHLLVSALQCLM